MSHTQIAYQMPRQQVYKLLAIASIVCAIVVWPSVNLSHPLLRLPDDLFGLTQPTTEQSARIREHLRLNDTIALALFGAVAMAAGIPVFANRMKAINLIGSLILALGIGAAGGWLMGLNGFYCEDWLPITWDVLIRVTVRWMAMLLPFALMAALLTALCTRSWNRTGTLLMAGLIGSLLAAITYTLITALVLPKENADAVLPHGTYSRLLLFGIAPLAIWATIEHQFRGGGRAEQTTSSAELNVA